MKGGEELDALDDLERLFLAAISQGHYRYLYKGRWRKALPLPWNVRLRLWCTGRVDHAAIWLVVRRQFRAAQALWRASGLWQATRRAK